MKKIGSYIDLAFFGKFLLIFIPLYFANLLFWGLVDPNNYYSFFIDNYLNYFDWITATILHTSNLMVHAAGINAVVDGNLLVVKNSNILQMEPACIGISNMIFWIAFIFAGSNTVRYKIKWSLIGIGAIWLLNCIRVAGLLYVLEHNLISASNVDTHEEFNYATYAVIILLIWIVNSKLGKANQGDNMGKANRGETDYSLELSAGSK